MKTIVMSLLVTIGLTGCFATGTVATHPAPQPAVIVTSPPPVVIHDTAPKRGPFYRHPGRHGH